MEETTEEQRTLVDRTCAEIMDLVAAIPTSGEVQSKEPAMRAREIICNAAIKAASTAGVLALPPGPLGMLTILPDIVAVWKLQTQMVADIAAIYGKTACLTKEQMIYCMFKHISAQLVRDLVVRVGERILVKRTTLRLLQRIIYRIAGKITQRVIGKALSRWLPIVGALGVAAYAYYDTGQVGETAIELFEQEIAVEDAPALDEKD